ncbi:MULTISPECIES: hypothetical protein [Methylobacillus]|nr:MULTISPECIES: hypothetical protein [Methylobacillus]
MKAKLYLKPRRFPELGNCKYDGAARMDMRSHSWFGMVRKAADSQLRI